MISARLFTDVESECVGRDLYVGVRVIWVASTALSFFPFLPAPPLYRYKVVYYSYLNPLFLFLSIISLFLLACVHICRLKLISNLKKIIFK